MDKSMLLGAAILAIGAGQVACSGSVTAEPPMQTQAPPPPAGPTGPTRTEHDLLGEKQIPADAYYGVQTARALENFQISGVPINHYPGVRRSVGDREAGRGARQHRCRAP